MVLQPWMLSATPAEVFLHDAVHNSLIAWLEPEGDSQRDFAALMQHARIVTELHIVAVDCFPDTVLTKQLRSVENLGDEHRALASRRGREKVQILPHGTADCAGDTDVMLETCKPARNGLGNEPGHHCPALNP